MFIVIEGLDGAGKSTQVARIQDYLTSQGRSWEYLHFPRFTSPYYGQMIARFLRGDLGPVSAVDPYLVAMLYAGDRLDAAAQIRTWIAQDKVVIVDRYVLSNVAYQCAKLDSGKQELKDWIWGLEYDHNTIPCPDLTLFLDVPFEFTERSLTNARVGDDRSYLDGKRDIHEASLDLQRHVREVFLEHHDPNYTIIDCSTPTGGMASAEEIFEKIVAQISRIV